MRCCACAGRRQRCHRTPAGNAASRVGASTGHEYVSAAQLAARMREAGETGAIVTYSDSGDRYLDTYYHPSR